MCDFSRSIYLMSSQIIVTIRIVVEVIEKNGFYRSKNGETSEWLTG